MRETWEGFEERSATFQPAFRRFVDILFLYFRMASEIESLQICFQDLAEQKSFAASLKRLFELSHDMHLERESQGVLDV